MMKIQVILLSAVVAVTIAAELPSSFKICKRSDPKVFECLADATANAVISMAKGVKSLKILPLEPLLINTVKIGNSGGSVSLEQEYYNMKLHGLTKGPRINSFQFDWDKLILISEAHNPLVELIADYKLKGNILLLPLRGNGKCNISLHELKTKHHISFEKIQKNGETYLKATKYSIKLLPERVTIQFDNLFDGDPALGKQMNTFINENSDLIFQEVRGTYEETFGLIFRKITNDIFLRVPMNKIFPLK